MYRLLVHWIHWNDHLGQEWYVIFPFKAPVLLLLPNVSSPRSEFNASVSPRSFCLDALREVVEAVPLDRILLETDAPYHFPGNNSKAVNHCGTIPAIAATISKVKDVPIEVVYHQIRQNTTDIYGI